MAGLLSFFVFAMLLSAVPVFGATEYRLGGINGNDWQAALTAESFFQIQDADGQPLRQVPVGISPFGAGADTLVDFSSTAIQPRLIDSICQYRPGRCGRQQDRDPPALYAQFESPY